jgi:hypothetical protein
METREKPAPQQEPTTNRPAQAKPMAESSREGVTVRVSVVNDRHDDEEKEAGYGHGV